MYDWFGHLFLEVIGFPCIRRNLRIVYPLDPVLFMLYDWNESCVSSQFVFYFYDRFVIFLNSGIVGSIKFFSSDCMCSYDEVPVR